MIKTNQGYKFEKSGREFSTHGSDGLSITEDMEIAYGYDGNISITNPENEYIPELTNEEKKEMAKYMIKLWTRFGTVCSVKN